MRIGTYFSRSTEIHVTHTTVRHKESIKRNELNIIIQQIKC